MYKFKTSQTYTPEAGETNTGISLTVPDQNLSVKEILIKYASGTLGDQGIEPQYNEESEDLRGLDYVQLHEMAQANNQQIKDLQKKIKEREDNETKERNEAKDYELARLRTELKQLKPE